MKSAYIDPFVQAGQEVLAVYLGQQPSRGVLSIRGNAATVAPVSIMARINGEIEGAVVYGLSLETGLRFASAMIGTPITVMDELGWSAITELANIITGHAARQFADSGTRCAVSPPQVVAGQHVELDAGSALVVPLHTDAGTLEIQVAMGSSPSRLPQALSVYRAAAEHAAIRVNESLQALGAQIVRMELRTVGIVPTSSLDHVAGAPEELVAGVYMRAHGRQPGRALLVFPYSGAVALCQSMTGLAAASLRGDDDLSESAFREFGNIVTSSFLLGLSETLQTTILPSPPLFACDMAAALVDEVLSDGSSYSEEMLSIVTDFWSENGVVEGMFMFIPELA